MAVGKRFSEWDTSRCKSQTGEDYAFLVSIEPIAVALDFIEKPSLKLNILQRLGNITVEDPGPTNIHFAYMYVLKICNLIFEVLMVGQVL